MELFGAPDRWSETLRTLLWTHASMMVPGFQGTTVIDVPIACTCDFEVVAAKYFESLEDAEAGGTRLVDVLFGEQLPRIC